MNLLFLFMLFPATISSREELCNPFECVDILDAAFVSSDLPELCWKSTQLGECFKRCVQNDNYVIKGLKNVQQFTCNGNYNITPATKCENQHKFKIYSCIYEKLHLEALAEEADAQLLNCRKALEGERCDTHSFGVCNGPGQYLTHDLVELFFHPLLTENCFYDRSEVYDLDLKTFKTVQNYNELATCLDNNSQLVSGCLANQIEFRLHDSHLDQTLCWAGYSLLACIQEIVHNKCIQLEKVSGVIGLSIFSSLLPRCFLEENVEDVSTVRTIKENAIDFNESDVLTTLTSVKESDAFVIHQQMMAIIKDDYYISSAARTFVISSFSIVTILFRFYINYSMF